MEKQYLIMVENMRTKKTTEAGFTPVNHKTACILMSKMMRYKTTRIFLQEVV